MCMWVGKSMVAVKYFGGSIVFWGFSPKIGQKRVILGIFLQKVHLDSGELETLHTYTLGEVVENCIQFIHESAP